MTIVPNYSQIPEREQKEFKQVETGTYDATIHTVKATADNEGNQAIDVGYKLQGTEFSGSMVWQNRIPFEGPKAWVHRSFHKGVTGEEAPNGIPIDEQQYCGLEVTIDVQKNGKYTNVKYPRKR